jgi:hypothetical protein
LFQFSRKNGQLSRRRNKKKNTQKRETEGELPKKSAGLAVGRFTLLFGGHFLLDTHLHLALQS